jgi:hypothetical protein
VTTFPLGRWAHQQRRAQRAGELEEHRKEQLDEAGMEWEPGEETWETKALVGQSPAGAANRSPSTASRNR